MTTSASTYSIGPDGKRQASRTKPLGKARDWPPKLDCTQFLDGKPMGNLVWQAQCTYDALRKTNASDEATLLLGAHLEKRRRVEACHFTCQRLEDGEA